MSRDTKLNVVFKLTTANGWRREWDMQFRDGRPATVTLAQFAPDGRVTTTPPPLLVSADMFFEHFFAEGGGAA